MKKSPTLMEFQTFRRLDEYILDGLQQEEPSCFNGIVRVRKYRVMVELVDEDEDVIKARILHLWHHNSRNYNDVPPLREIAHQYGLELDIEEFGRYAR